MARWLWNSSASSDADTRTKTNPTETSQVPSSSTFFPSTATPQSTPPDSQQQPEPSHPRTHRNAARISATSKLDQLNRDEDAALAELKAAFADPDSTTSPSSQTTHEPPPDIPTNSLYPTTLSCAQCFDAAYYCSSIGGQFTSIYRYGAMRSCSDLWAQWRFCMRTKTMGEQERRRRIWEWNREKEARRRVGRNSEEVWGLRTEGPTRGGVGDEGGGEDRGRGLRLSG